MCPIPMAVAKRRPRPGRGRGRRFLFAHNPRGRRCRSQMPLMKKHWLVELSRPCPGTVPVILYIYRYNFKEVNQLFIYSFLVVPVVPASFSQLPRNWLRNAQIAPGFSGHQGVSSPLEVHRDDVLAALHQVDVIRIGLHHNLALLLELFTVVGFAIFVVGAVR